MSGPGQRLGQCLSQVSDWGNVWAGPVTGTRPGHLTGPCPDIAPVTGPAQRLPQSLTRPRHCPSHWPGPDIAPVADPAQTLPQSLARPRDCPSCWPGPEIAPVAGPVRRARPRYWPSNCPGCISGSVIGPAQIMSQLSNCPSFWPGSVALQGILTLISLHKPVPFFNIDLTYLICCTGP